MFDKAIDVCLNKSIRHAAANKSVHGNADPAPRGAIAMRKIAALAKLAFSSFPLLVKKMPMQNCPAAIIST